MSDEVKVPEEQPKDWIKPMRAIVSDGNKRGKILRRRRIAKMMLKKYNKRR